MHGQREEERDRGTERDIVRGYGTSGPLSSGSMLQIEIQGIMPGKREMHGQREEERDRGIGRYEEKDREDIVRNKYADC